MANINGQDMVDIMAQGIESIVKPHVRDVIVANLISEFKDKITEVVDKELSEMIFQAQSHENQGEFRKDFLLLIEWSKGQAEYKKKYSVVSEIVED